MSEPNTKVQFSFELWKRKETFYAQAKWFLCFFAQIAKRSCQLHFYLGVIFIKYALEYNFLSAKHLQYKKNSYLCTQITGAPVVQWIELRFPKPSIRVRFPAGVLSTPSYSTDITLLWDSRPAGAWQCARTIPYYIYAHARKRGQANGPPPCIILNTDKSLMPLRPSP